MRRNQCLLDRETVQSDRPQLSSRRRGIESIIPSESATSVRSGFLEEKERGRSSCRRQLAEEAKTWGKSRNDRRDGAFRFSRIPPQSPVTCLSPSRHRDGPNTCDQRLTDGKHETASDLGRAFPLPQPPTRLLLDFNLFISPSPLSTAQSLTLPLSSPLKSRPRPPYCLTNNCLGRPQNNRRASNHCTIHPTLRERQPTWQQQNSSIELYGPTWAPIEQNRALPPSRSRCISRCGD